MIDDQNMALNETAETETADTTPVVDETAVNQEYSTDSTEESKKGYSNRVRELNQKAKEAEARAASLQDKLTELTGQVRPGEYAPNMQPLPPIVNPGEEISLDELNKRQQERELQLMRYAAQVSGLQSQQALTLERINREAKESLIKHSELDPNSDSFDRELSDTLTEAAEAYVKANPTKSLAEFVDKQMKLHKRAVGREVQAEQTEIAKQKSESAIRPTPAKSEDKKFEDLSLEEMEARLGYAH